MLFWNSQLWEDYLVSPFCLLKRVELYSFLLGHDAFKKLLIPTSKTSVWLDVHTHSPHLSHAQLCVHYLNPHALPDSSWSSGPPPPSSKRIDTPSFRTSIGLTSVKGGKEESCFVRYFLFVKTFCVLPSPFSLLFKSRAMLLSVCGKWKNESWQLWSCSTGTCTLFVCGCVMRFCACTDSGRWRSHLSVAGCVVDLFALWASSFEPSVLLWF